ncbi:hypothetical protein GCM10007173_04460 [Glutamicibacter ardleyensis]|uniref:Uncharacterized protein n=1 Tax=Glutamicibacter ardleyensis TaxID=225894 RepID=A0ABQ2D7U0_9MICC|nr:hypothetical protein GCM10007173_04460 [Glutamicibacter ardleyensis]
MARRWSVSVMVISGMVCSFGGVFKGYVGAFRARINATRARKPGGIRLAAGQPGVR